MDLLQFKDKRYVIKYKVQDVNFTPDKIDWLKWYKEADQVLRKNGILYFVQEIIDIEFTDIK